MNIVQRIDERIQREMVRYNTEMRNRVTITPRASKISARIKALQEEKAQILSNERYSLASQLPDDETTRNEVYHQIIKLPIIADFLYSSTVDLQSLLKRLGVTEVTIAEKVKQIREISSKLAFLLSDFPALEKILSEDDVLIDGLHKKVDSFLRQRMRVRN